MSRIIVTKNIDKLLKLEKVLKEKVVIKTGIFAENDNRKDGKSNVKIGYDHEFGTLYTAKRSWLRVPFFLKLKQIEDVAISSIKDGLEKGSLKGLYSAIAKECKHIVLGAFVSGGYGTWKAISPETAARKGNTRILRDTDQFMKAVKSKVVKE